MKHDREGDILQSSQPGIAGIAPSGLLAYQGIPDFTSRPAAVTRIKAIVPAGKGWQFRVSTSRYGLGVPANHPVKEPRLSDLIHSKQGERPIIATHITT